MQIWRSIDGVSHRWAWDFISWEVENISEKLRWQFLQPLQTLSPDEQAQLVRDYLERAREISELEWQLDQRYAGPPSTPVAGTGSTHLTRLDDARAAMHWRQLQARLSVLREQQALVRPAVESAIERQVSNILAEQQISAGPGVIPPVWFTFTEPPRKLVASPRARIDTVYYAMLQSHLPAHERDRIESETEEEFNLSAYVTNIGGLGAFPAIVSDQASMPWVLSTVAHEWVHNYLTLFPLGFNYGATAELTILNETIADIAGDELGALALRSNYPEQAFAFEGKDQPAVAALRGAAAPFDFGREMRHTREVVDQFLGAGRVQDAEEYMRIRQQLFRENGYYLRKLNQAYFAFHGSYGTGVAATSPIGPKLQQLRSRMPDLRTFLETVRWFTSESDLDAALQAWSLS